MLVEHEYEFIQKYWTKNQFSLVNWIDFSLVAAYYLTACLMTNIMTCLQENQISMQFECLLILLDEYFDELLAAEREDVI